MFLFKLYKISLFSSFGKEKLTKTAHERQKRAQIKTFVHVSLSAQLFIFHRHYHHYIFLNNSVFVSQNAKNCQSERQKLLVRTPLTENEWLTQERKPCKSF